MGFLTDIGNNLSNLFHQGASAVGNEVHQLPQQIQQVAQPIEQGVGNAVNQAQHIQIPQQAINFGNMASTFGQHVGQAIANTPLNQVASVLPGAGSLSNPAFNKFAPSVGQFVQGHYIQPAQTALNPTQNPLNRIMAATQVGINTIAPVASTAYNVGGGAAAGALKTIRQGGNLASNIKQSIANPSDIGGTGLGIKNPILATGVDLATGNPKALVGGVKGIAQAVKGYSPNGFNIHPDDQKIMSDFINAVQSGSGKANLGQLGKDAQALAEHYIGKSAVRATNERLAQAFDALLSSAAKARGEDVLQTPFPKMGFVQTPKITNNLQDALAGAQNPQDEATIINQFTEHAIQNQSGNSLKATRAALNQELQSIVGQTGKYKTDYAAQQVLKDSSDIGARIQALQDNIAKIDSTNGGVNNKVAGLTQTNQGISTPNTVLSDEQKIEQGSQPLLGQEPNLQNSSNKTVAQLSQDTQYAKTGTVPTQAAIKARVGQPTAQEQGSIQDFEKNVLGNKQIDNFNPEMGVQTENPNLKVKAPPENPNGGVAAVNPQEVANQARLARSGTMQNIQYRAQTLASQMQQVLKTPEDNLNIRLALESPEKMDYYAKQSRDPQAFKQIAQQYSDFTDHVAKQIQGSGNKMGFINNYFTHIWDLSTPEAQQTFNDLMAANAKDFTSGFTKTRIVKTIEEGLGKGLTLANPKASQDVVQYANSMGMQAGAGAFDKTINDLRPGGAVPLGQTPYNYQGRLFKQSNVPGNEGTAIDPELQAYMGHYNPSGLSDNPVIAGKDVNVGGTTLHIPGIDQINQIDKETKLALGGFHALNTSLRMASNNPTVIPSAIRSMFDMGYRNQLAQKAIDDGVIDFGTKHGVTFSSSGDVLPQGATTLQNIKSLNPITKFNNALFGGMINTYKMNLVRGMMGKFKNADSDPGVAKQAQNYGAQINHLMGGLNYEAMGRNKTVQQVFRLVGLAPDFSEGTLRQLVSAFNPAGYANVTTRPASIFALRNVIGQVVISAGLAEMGRKLVTGNFSPDFKSFVANSVLNPNIPLPNNATFNNPKSGKTQSAFLPATEFNTLARGVKNPGQFLQARGSGIVSAGGSLASGKDYYGNPLVNPFSGKPDNLQNRAAALLPNQLPIPVQQILKATQKTQVTSNPNAPKVPIQTPATTALNIAGLRVANNPNDPRTIAQQQYFNGLNQAAQNLNPNDQKIFMGQIHPTTKDADGNPVVDKNPLTSPAKYDTLLSNPNVLAAEVKFQQSQPNHDPLWDLNPAQLKAYMQAQVISKNDPGGDKATVNALYGAIPQSFYDQRTQFFNKLVSSGQMPAQAVNQYKVAANPAVSQFWNSYFKLPVGSAARKAMINSPLGQQAMAQTQQQTQLTNQQRLDMGLPLLTSTSSKYGTYTKKPAKVSIKGTGAGTVPKLGSFKILSNTKKANLSNKLGTSKTNSIKMAKQASVKPLKIAAGSKPLSGKKTSAFKITSPRVLLSTSGGSQRGVRKQAGISIPTKKRRMPFLTV